MLKHLVKIFSKESIRFLFYLLDINTFFSDKKKTQNCTGLDAAGFSCFKKKNFVKKNNLYFSSKSILKKLR